MAFIPFNDGVRAVISQGLSGSTPWSNTLWFLHSGGAPSVTDLENLADALVSWWTLQVNDYQSSSVLLNQIEVYDMSAENGPVITTTSGAAGSQSGELISPANCAVIKFGTNFRGRSARGRNFVSGFVESQAVYNGIDSTTLNGLETAYGLLPSYASPEGFLHVVASFFLNGAARSEALAQLVTSYTVRSAIFGSQRLRNQRQ